MMIDETATLRSILNALKDSNISDADSHAIHGQFTEDEMQAIKEMLKSWQESVPAIKREPTLHKRIKQLPQEEKTRKTIVIDQSIGERFDVFCEAERLNKSDILHLALADFMDNFD